jgi:LPS-assembly lipoprotein
LQEKVILSRTSAGSVREFQLRFRIRFKLRTRDGIEVIPDTELVQERDISFSETAALSKETEEGLLYRDMRSDLVQQVLRRLAVVRMP